MKSKLVCALLCLFLPTLLDISPCCANSYMQKRDNNIVALDLQKGTFLWINKEIKLSSASFKVFPEGLVAQPDPWLKKSDQAAVFLNPKTGEKIPAFNINKSHLLAGKRVQAATQLDNGWRLINFKPGYSTSLQFADPKTGKIVWEISNLNYPHQVQCWKNTVLFSFSSCSVNTGQARLYAREAGSSKDRWVIIPDWILHGRGWAELRQMSFDIIEDTVYIEANEHTFAVDPATGNVLFHKDLSKDLGLKYHCDLEGDEWAFGWVSFAEDKNILLTSFDRRLIAFDLKAKKYLWTFEPGIFPEQANPVVYHGRIFTTAGQKSRLLQLQ